MTSLRSLRRRQLLATAALPLMVTASLAAPTQRRIVLDLAEAK